MPHSFRSRSSSFRHALLPALVCAVLPLASATAQGLPRVQTDRDETALHVMRFNTSDIWLLTEAPAGTVMDVLYVEGDRMQHRDSNWYLVLLPRDEWGTQRAAWISGREVEPAPPAAPPVTSQRATPLAVPPGLSAVPRPPAGQPTEQVVRRAAEDAAASAPAEAAPVPPEVILNFAFGKSDLLDAAKGQLGTALTALKASTGTVSFALEGHADSTGSEAFNQALGLARAEAVRQYIADALQTPADRISVISYGEERPAASNTTKEGRAQNRRVVVKVTR